MSKKTNDPGTHFLSTDVNGGDTRDEEYGDRDHGQFIKQMYPVNEIREMHTDEELKEMYSEEELKEMKEILEKVKEKEETD